MPLAAGPRSWYHPVRLDSSESMAVRILSQEQVTSILDMKTCVDLVEQALRTLTRGGAVLPLRTVLRIPDGRGVFGTMPPNVDLKAILAP